MPRQLDTTSRKHLRNGAGVNTKFWLDPSIYTLDGVPNQKTLDALIPLDVGYIRERWAPRDPAQAAAFTQVTDAGIGLVLFIGSIWTYTPSRAAADVAALAESPFADSVVAVCGPNEANGPQDDKWPKLAVEIQKAIYETAFSYPDFGRHVSIVSCSLMHNNVADLDADYRALRKAGIRRWCEAGDLHYYPGNAGPITNLAEAERAREAFGKLPLWHTETGWTTADTDPDTAGRFTVEAVLRNHLNGMVGTIIYEFADESDYVAGREGLFGVRTPTAPKPAYTELRTLLATPDGKEEFPGWLANYSKGVKSDVGAVVTSEGGGQWTVYLMQEQQDKATIVLPDGAGGKKRYKVAMDESMKVVQVTA
jgi:hypothetical protein